MWHPAVASSMTMPMASMAMSGSSFSAGWLFENIVEQQTLKLSEK